MKLKKSYMGDIFVEMEPIIIRQQSEQKPVGSSWSLHDHKCYVPTIKFKSKRNLSTALWARSNFPSIINEASDLIGIITFILTFSLTLPLVSL